MAGPHCLIYEPDVTGHRLQHVRHLADALLEIGCRVSLALPADFRNHPEFEVHISAREPHIEIVPQLDPHQSSSLSARRRRLKELFNTIGELEPDRAYVPFADGITQLAGWKSHCLEVDRFAACPLRGRSCEANMRIPSAPFERASERLRTVTVCGAVHGT